MENDKTANYWVRRFESLEIDRQAYWQNHHQTLSDLILPRKSNIATQREKGADLNSYAFDSTAIHANELLASRMQASLVPGSSRWFDLTVKFPEKDKEVYGESAEYNTEIQKWLDQCSDKMYEMLNGSNFNTVIQEFFLDLGCFGTACMSMEGVRGISGNYESIKFKSIPIQSYVFSENTDGEVDLVFLKLKKTARQAFQRFDPKKLHPNIHEALKEEPEKEFNFLQAVYPREDFDPHTKKTAKDMPYGNIVIDKDHKEIVEETGYQEFPFFVTRWAKSSGEKYGRGPGRTAIHDIQNLNNARHLENRAWGKLIDPPLMVEDDTYMGNFRVVPNSIIRVRDITRPPMPLVAQIPGGWQVTSLKKDELVQSIKRIFYSDQLQFPEQEQNKMTAREVMVRYELMQTLLGSTFGRITTELLHPLIGRLFSKLERDKNFPQRPAMLANVKELDIEYKSPLAMAQKAEPIKAIDVFLESTLPLLQFDPGALDMVDFKKLVQCKAELLGVPAKIMREDKEAKEIGVNRDEAAKEATNREKTLQDADALNKMAPFLGTAGKMSEQLNQEQEAGQI